MPKLPKFRTRGQSVPTAQGGEQPWNVRYDTGGEMIAQEAQQGAQLLGKVNREMINAKRQSNVASTKAKATELNSIAQDKINNMDPEEIGEFDPDTNSVRLYEQTEQVINGLDEAIPDGLGEEEAQQMIEGYKARLRATARSTLRKKEASKIRAEGETAVNTFLKNGKMNSALEQIDTMDEAGALEEGEEVRMKEKVAPKAEFYLAQQAIKNGVSVKDIKKNPKETLDPFAPDGEGWEEHLDEGELSMGSEDLSRLQKYQEDLKNQAQEQRADFKKAAMRQIVDEGLNSVTESDIDQWFVEEKLTENDYDALLKFREEYKKRQQSEPQEEEVTADEKFSTFRKINKDMNLWEGGMEDFNEIENEISKAAPVIGYDESTQLLEDLYSKRDDLKGAPSLDPEQRTMYNEVKDKVYGDDSTDVYMMKRAIKDPEKRREYKINKSYSWYANWQQEDLNDYGKQLIASHMKRRIADNEFEGTDDALEYVRKHILAPAKEEKANMELTERIQMMRGESPRTESSQRQPQLQPLWRPEE